MHRIFLFGIVCCALFGCQKKETKPSVRSIYDRSVFAEMALSAAKDDAQFAVFKRNPFFNLLWENLSKEEGEVWLKRIQENYPALLEKMEAFAASDKVGSPRTFSFEGAGEFSPSTLRLAAIAGQIHASLYCARLGSEDLDFARQSQIEASTARGLQEEHHFQIGKGDDKDRFGKVAASPNLQNLTVLSTRRMPNVVQIGAGYGGLCKILHDISSYTSYTIVDLPEQLALARRYLEAFGLNGVIYKTPDELPKSASYDWVISDMSFSEFNRSEQQRLFDRVFAHAKAGFILGRVFPKHYGVAPLGWEEIKGRFEKKGKFSLWEIEEPTIEKENYLICFRRES